MDKFQYVITKNAFEKATTIKERVRIFKDVVNQSTSPYSYILGMELKKLLRPKDVLLKDEQELHDKIKTLKKMVKKALLTQEEVDLVFGNSILNLEYPMAEDIVKICNKTPNLRCRMGITPTNITSPLSPYVSYYQRGIIELIMHRDSIHDYQNNKLYKQLISVYDYSYDKTVEPLLQFIDKLAPLKDPTGANMKGTINE